MLKLDGRPGTARNNALPSNAAPLASFRKTIPVFATQMTEDFSVDTGNGVQLGGAGDYYCVGPDGRSWMFDQAGFEATYSLDIPEPHTVDAAWIRTNGGLFGMDEAATDAMADAVAAGKEPVPIEVTELVDHPAGSSPTAVADQSALTTTEARVVDETLKQEAEHAALVSQERRHGVEIAPTTASPVAPSAPAATEGTVAS